MLVLTRKAKEAVMVGAAGGIGRELKVTVLEIRNGVVKLGFEVDPAVPLHRPEVWELVRAGAEPHVIEVLPALAPRSPGAPPAGG